MLDVISFAKAQASMGADVIQDVDITALNTAIGMPYSNNDSLSTRVTTLEGKTFLPNVTSTDNNKVLMVDNAAWSVQNVPASSSIIWLDETITSDDQYMYATINLTYNELLTMVNNGQIPVLRQMTSYDDIAVTQVCFLDRFGFDDDNGGIVTFVSTTGDLYAYTSLEADTNFGFTDLINPK